MEFESIKIESAEIVESVEQSNRLDNNHIDLAKTDSIPPILEIISISSNTASPGDKITITAKTMDDLLGVKCIFL